MKKLKKVSLSNLAKNELESRELRSLLGGANCCICGCQGPSGTQSNANANNADDWGGTAGYGTGSFRV